MQNTSHGCVERLRRAGGCIFVCLSWGLFDPGPQMPLLSMPFPTKDPYGIKALGLLLIAIMADSVTT